MISWSLNHSKIYSASARLQVFNLLISIEWKSRYDATLTLFDFIETNASFLDDKNFSKMADLADSIGKLISDSNAKI
jgi:hypothetical protein